MVTSYNGCPLPKDMQLGVKMLTVMAAADDSLEYFYRENKTWYFM